MTLKIIMDGLCMFFYQGCSYDRLGCFLSGDMLLTRDPGISTNLRMTGKSKKITFQVDVS